VTGYDARGCRDTLPENHVVTYYHSHNLVDKDRATAERRFGIRVTLPPSDTFSKMLGESWENIHWYRSEEERDRAFENMATRHGYYRNTDTPTQVLEKIVR
jgi:hypothetical protein